ncbi:acyl carrier protein phosphodiesterase [Zobellia galactanivorans]|uniref:Acyl carrier protein phosphodiesterase n=1 Tax=Zobellia galactanivorans (strain DSM 12802 / CCUG 47099 / CIP 106680 / NCIMB 13871 / Dsij) TaxID=63186 RepID=G0L6N8_ZOBGA|nr:MULTISPECIES: acyl carrier protein phosphodiesterase [Zobellia]MBU3024789.1 acyl carrier protein phosphodiesterase [Zobellia galactanivorans]MDO6808917.1 acyl carrier protein phosphodiesterase [Zobellia galactanivorans]OWW25891.1 ACP phosphodiesterase [Zobellia sp. OII3]CAZ98548.1 Acyl carrier protein phosphodiesterase [Zobellia galactanivorans]
MNFLAHIYLSFDDPEITLGNFIADSIRGNKFKHLPERVQKGIMLHRDIDTFTDTHEIPKISSKRLHKNYSHYSRVIVDIFYDHYLAKNWDTYSETPLDIYVDNFYDLLEENYSILPVGVQRMMPYMISDNWIYNYSKMEGIAKVLKGMNRRTNNISKMNFAILDLEEHYEKFEEEFTAFFDELLVFSKQKFISL